MMIRKATIQDVKKIQKLIRYYADKDEMLPRSLNELYESVRDYYVCFIGKRLVGCCALSVCWNELGEIKSLAVAKSRQGQGIGSSLLRACLLDARRLGLKKIFVLTYNPMYFKRFGFKEIDKSTLPHKIWSECIRCVKFPECNEVAMTLEL